MLSLLTRVTPWRAFWLAFIVLNAFGLWAVSATADLDQAEQLVFSQAWQLGYSAQPPLYTWLVAGLFTFTGPHLGALLLLKAALLAGLVILLDRLALRVGLSDPQRAVALAGLALLPQFLWEAQRDLTHSILAAVFSLALLLQALRARERGRVGDYLLLGGLAGLGLLSKYNLVLLLAALVVAAALSPTYRVLLRGPWPWVAALVATAVLAPHLAWVAGHAGIAAGIEGKLNQADATAWAGLGAVLVKAIAFLTPLWLFVLPWIWRAARDRAWPDSPAWRFLAVLFLAVLGVMVGFVLASGADRIRDRWYMPLLPFVPVLVAALAPARPSRILLATGAGLMLVTAILLPLRTLMIDHSARPMSVNEPYAAHFAAIAAETGAPVLIYAENKFIGGNARLSFPEARVVTPDFDRTPEPSAGPVWLLCEQPRCGTNFRTWLAEQRGLDPAGLDWHASWQPYVGSARHRHSLWWSLLARPKAPS